MIRSRTAIRFVRTGLRRLRRPKIPLSSPFGKRGKRGIWIHCGNGIPSFCPGLAFALPAPISARLWHDRFHLASTALGRQGRDCFTKVGLTSSDQIPAGVDHDRDRERPAAIFRRGASRWLPPASKATTSSVRFEPIYLVTRPEIKSAAELRSKSSAVTRLGSSTHFYLRAALRAASAGSSSFCGGRRTRNGGGSKWQNLCAALNALMLCRSRLPVCACRFN
jgi:hypothetical protein